MMSLWSGPPENAERFERLAIETSESNGRFFLRAWRGKAKKPFVNYYYTSAEARDREVEGLKESETASLAFRAKMREEDARRTKEMRESLTVGTLLHGSWGYDQTNCELFEVVGRPSPSVAEIRKVRAEHVSSEGLAPMAEFLRPVPGETYGETLRRRIGPSGLKLHDHCYLTPTDPAKKHYNSWYH